MKKTLIKSLIRIAPVTVLFTLAACGGSSSDDPKPEPVPEPAVAVLAFPANNEVCFDGTVISATMSEVPFSWNPAENADKYELVVTNLETNARKTYPASNVEIAVSLDRGAPYSWYVTSLGNNTNASANSESWKFYLAGEGITNYAPFPAELLEPASGSTWTSSTVNFSWNGNDVDSQDLTYTLYVDIIDGKTDVLVGSLSESSFQATLSPATTYFWSVVTTDPEGNTSRSPVFSFKTN